MWIRWRNQVRDGFTSNLNYTSPQLTGTGYVDTRYNASGDNYKSRGLLTGTIVCQLNNTNNKSYSVFYYDNKDRIVFSNSTNHLSGFDRAYTNYTFTGSPKLVLKEQTISGNSNPVKEKYVYSYDHAGRLTSVDHSYNGNTAVEITKNTYDNIGRLASTKHNGESSLQTQYAYNVRSWITGITSPGFNQEIVYNKADGSVRTGFFGGNILETKWKHTPSGTLQNYTYTYDNLSRLTSAVSPTGLFNESASYDMNGNISSLIRHATSGVIDNLVYNYDGNRIIRITDNALHDSGFVYRAPGNPGDITYTYDRNGSMTGDYHRSVGIEYNLLNLPKKVTNTLDTTKNMTYVYDSQGRKLRQTTRSGGAVSLTEDYIDNMIYKNGTLAKVLIPGGYISVSGTQTSYHYFALDHLGNVRQVLSSNGQQEEQDDYYPFGLRQNRSSYQLSDNKYKYNGKEQEEFGDMTTLDFHARFYMPDLGRTTTQDRHAETYLSISPYSMFANNPMFFTDPTGEDINFYVWKYDEERGFQRSQVQFNQLDAKLQKALEAFAKTDKGFAFLKDFANEGDKIGSVEFSATGKYAKHDMDFAQLDKYGSAYGYSTFREGKDNVIFDMKINVNRNTENENTESMAITTGHEAFIHIDQYKDKLLNAYNKGDKATVNKIDAQHRADAADRNGGPDHDGYIRGDKKYTNMRTFISQLRTVLNPTQVNKQLQLHDKKYKK